MTAGWPIKITLLTQNGEVLPEQNIIKEAMKRFRACRKYDRIVDLQKIDFAIQTAGTQWGVALTPKQIIDALDIAGFKIVRRPRKYFND